jgi:predicted DNA-binding transcriptional regulator AlpA
LQFFPLMVRAVNKPTVESLASRVDQLERFVPFAFLTAKGVQTLLGWSRSTFYRHLGELPRRTRWGWRLADLQAAIQAGQLPDPAAGQ